MPTCTGGGDATLAACPLCRACRQAWDALPCSSPTPSRPAMRWMSVCCITAVVHHPAELPAVHRSPAAGALACCFQGERLAAPLVGPDTRGLTDLIQEST